MPSPRLKTAVVVLGAALLAGSGTLLVLRGIDRFRTPSHPAVDRGRAVASGLGCFTCHGPDGGSGIPNPGSATGAVPPWGGGTAMMFVREDAEIREWILDGAPRRLREDPGYRERMEKALVRMPAFRGRVEGRDLEDLLAFFGAVAWTETPEPEAALRGREEALEHGCFGCHGPEGRGNARNPGGFKGFIPSWDGPGFPELVRDESELRNWILDGGTPRISGNAVARHFITRQAIAMPAFRDRLDDGDLDGIVAYIAWLRGGRIATSE